MKPAIQQHTAIIWACLPCYSPHEVYPKEGGAYWAGDGYDDQETNVRSQFPIIFFKLFGRMIACQHAGAGVVRC